MPLTYATATHTGLMRRTNEDAYFARPPVFAVADGMGGAEAGEVASAMAARAFERFPPEAEQTERELAQMIAAINSEIYGYAMSDSGRAGMGTTIIAAVVGEHDVTIAHVGDSRAWLWRAGRLKRLTEDHSLVAEMIKEGQITEAEAARHPQRSIITRALGVEPGVKVDTATVAWEPGDLFLLASDGLYGMVPEEEMAGILSREMDLPGSAHTLLEAANAGGGHDNITVVLISPDGSRPGAYGAEADMSVHDAQGARPQGSGSAASGSDEAGFARTAAAELSLSRRLLARVSTPWGLLAVGVLLATLVLGGAWYATRFLYYVGVDGGRVSIYQGLPYQLGPLSLSTLYRRSSVDLATLQPYWRDRVQENNIQSRSGASQMLDNLVQIDRNRRNQKQQAPAQAGTPAQPAPQYSVTVPQGGLP